jgi:hypothetical protein
MYFNIPKPTAVRTMNAPALQVRPSQGIVNARISSIAKPQSVRQLARNTGPRNISVR